MAKILVRFISNSILWFSVKNCETLDISKNSQA